MTVNATRIEQIIRAARPVPYPRRRSSMIPATTVLAALVIIHNHEGESMAAERLARLLYLSRTNAEIVLRALVDAGFVRTERVPRTVPGKGGRARGYWINQRAMVTAAEDPATRRTRNVAA